MIRTNKMECQYCKNVFKTNSSLKTHQLKAKYCLKLRGKNLFTNNTVTEVDVHLSNNTVTDIDIQ